ncbi:MAG: FtsX-like permease family protein [Luteitalea sp.]|nr:FtsX-like permease family protein [Luteitalea sp.]
MNEGVVTRKRRAVRVRAASSTVHVPFGNDGGITDVSIDRPIPGTKDDSLSCARAIVGPRFFETTGVTLARGRPFERTDTAALRRVAVINETMARARWPKRDPIGRRFRVYGDWVEVVGVARNGKYLMLYEDARAYLYLPLSQLLRVTDDRVREVGIQRGRSRETAQTASARDGSGLTPVQRPHHGRPRSGEHVRPHADARGRVHGWDTGTDRPLPRRDGPLRGRVVRGGRRTREIGIRMALGAKPSSVMRLVVREGMRLSLVGMVIGLLVAFGVGVVLSGLLYGVAPMDVAVLGGVTALLLTVSALACYVPARRATRVDPLETLRAE